LTSKAQELLKVLADHNSNAFSELPGETSFCPKIAQAKPPGISLAGKVAAGSPIEAIENKELLSLNSCFGSGDDIFALEVAGDSMLGDDIHNGDYVICLRSAVADEGQLVIAIINGEEATLKRFYKEKSCVRLQPANDNYQPIYSDNCRIEAVVVGLVRKF
jgi:repressor LexA